MPPHSPCKLNVSKERKRKKNLPLSWNESVAKKAISTNQCFCINHNMLYPAEDYAIRQGFSFRSTISIEMKI